MPDMQFLLLGGRQAGALLRHTWEPPCDASASDARVASRQGCSTKLATVVRNASWTALGR